MAGLGDEYDSRTNLFFKTEQDGSVVVYDVIEEREPARTKVFQATISSSLSMC
jgi:hypothetical protein